MAAPIPPEKNLPWASEGTRFLATGWQNRHFHNGIGPYDRWTILLTSQHSFSTSPFLVPKLKKKKEKEVPTPPNVSQASS